MSDKTTNPYFELKKGDFLAAAAKRLEMKKDFSPDQISEYASINAEYAFSAAELIKLGIEWSLDEDTVVITVDGDNYDVPSKDIRNALGENQFNYIFEKKKSNESAANEEDYVKVDAESYSEPSPSMDFKFNNNNSNMLMNPMMMNPFLAMMNYFMYPFQYAYGAQTSGFMQQQPESTKVQETKGSGDELSDILKNISEIQKQVISLEKEKVGSKEYVSNLKNHYETAKKDLKEAEDRNTAEKEQHATEMQNLQRIVSEMDKKYELLEKEKITLEETNQVLQSDFEKIRLENEQKNSAIEELKAEKSRIEDHLNGIGKQSETEKRNTEEKLRSLQDEKRRNAQEIDRLKTELKTNKADIEGKTDLFRSTTQERDNLKREVQSLRQELEKMKNSNASLKSKNTSLFSEMNALKENSQKLQQDSQKFEDLAYVDKKTGLLNINAFNRDFKATEKNDIVAAVLHICGMKGINDSYGRKNGDTVIKKVGKTATEFFPNANIYRIYGDQFFIVNKNGNMNSVKGQLFDMKNKLAGEQIEIAYGAAAGYESTDHNDIIEKINKEVREMKQNANSAPQMNYAAMVTTTPQGNAPVQETALEEESLDEAIMNYMS